jgi:hypothetical protein
VIDGLTAKLTAAASTLTAATAAEVAEDGTAADPGPDRWYGQHGRHSVTE